MTPELPPNSQKSRSFSLSIGQLTFGSFLLVLAVIIATSTVNIIAIRRINATFSELQRLQSASDLAEDIDRRMNELRLAARDFVINSGTQSAQIEAAAASLSDILKHRRLELGPEQQDMIDGVAERLSTYRNGIEYISGLLNRRAELIIELPPIREQFNDAIADNLDSVVTATLSQAQTRIALALLAHNPLAAELSAQGMRSMTISHPKLRSAVDAYAEVVIAISGQERQISNIDKDVLGEEGRLTQRVTELLRKVNARHGHDLSRDFAATLADAKWQSIVLGATGVLIALFAALLVVHRTVRPLALITASIRAVAGGEKSALIPSTDVNNEIGDIARAAEVFRQTLIEVDDAREAAVHALAEQRKAKDAAETALQNLRNSQNSLIEAEKLAALGRLVVGVAHEINNPVGISLTVATTLERKTESFAAEVARGELRRSSLNEYLNTNREASSQLVANLQRAAELIQSFKQVAADRNFSDQRSFDLGTLTEQIAMSLRPSVRKHNLTLNVECQPNLIMNSYPGPYGQVLTNLFINSVLHAFPDGKSGTIEIKAKESGPDHVEILFSDNGIGMSPEVRRRAFEPFFTTRRDQGGTGLGMHIIYSIVINRLGGKLELDSEPGKGTRIQIILPKVAPLEQTAE